MGRIGRSFQLVGQSYRILMQDKELMVLPLISGIFIMVAVAAMAVGFGLNASHLQRRGPELYIPVFLFYVVTYTIGLFFQAAVVAGATERMRGGDPTIGTALAAASRRFGPIVLWAIVAATAGMVIRAIHDRVGFVGRASLGVAASCAWLTLIAITGLLAMAIGVAAVAVFVVGAVALLIFFSALQGVYVASLYRFATDGGATPGLDPTLLRQAFRPK